MAAGDWPDGELRADAPYEVRVVLGISRRLRDAIGGRGLRSVAVDADVSIGAISHLLNGKTWGDVVTVARLEQALGVSLWIE